LRNLRLLALAVIAALGVTAVAFAQGSGNQYSLNADVKVRGGSPSKPKPGSFKLGFDISDPAGTVPQVVKTYFIGAEGLKVDTRAATRTCSAASLDRRQSDRHCPRAALIGSGTIRNFVATPGEPVGSATRCTLPVKLYAAGRNRVAIWIQTGPPNCIAAVAKAIDARFVRRNGVIGLQFTVPDELRHQLGLALPVSSVRTSFRKITRRIGRSRKQIGYFSSTGCRDGRRDIIGRFTDETGRTVTAKTTLRRC